MDQIKCAYCGQVKEGAPQFWIGAPPPEGLDDLGWTKHEGTGKYSCPNCRPIGDKEAELLINRFFKDTKKDTKKDSGVDYKYQEPYYTMLGRRLLPSVLSEGLNMERLLETVKDQIRSHYRRFTILTQQQQDDKEGDDIFIRLTNLYQWKHAIQDQIKIYEDKGNRLPKPDSKK